MTPEEVKDSRELIERAYRLSGTLLRLKSPAGGVLNDMCALAEHLLDDAVVARREPSSIDTPKETL